MARAFVSPRRRIGKSTSRPNWPRCSRSSKPSRRSSTLAQKGGKKVSLADLIVLGGCAAVDAAAKKAGHNVKVGFAPGRTDASQAQTDVSSFAVLEPTADGFRNYIRKGLEGSAAELLLDQGATAHAHRSRVDGSHRRLESAGRELWRVSTGRLHQAARSVDERFLRESARHEHEVAEIRQVGRRFEGRDRKTGEVKWTGTVVDLVFGSNSQLRALAEVYASSDSEKAFVEALWPRGPR